MDDMTINSHSHTEENPEKNESTDTMASLYWMLILTLALLKCLTGHPTPVKRLHNNFEQLNTIIDMLKHRSCAEKDATFYSPKGKKNETNKCIKESLECCSTELGTVIGECFADDIETSMILNKTRALINEKLEMSNYTLKTADKDCICEGEKEGYKEFLENIRRLFQKLNSSQERSSLSDQ